MDLQKAFSSSIGSKFLIAFTGLSFSFSSIAHLAGNLLFIAGPDAFNEYSHKLVSNPLVYVAELGLLAVFVLHIFKTVGMVAGSYSARPQRYAKKKWAKSKNDRSRKSAVVVDDDPDRHDHAAVRRHAPGDVQVRHRTTKRLTAFATCIACSSRCSAIPATSPSTSSRWA